MPNAVTGVINTTIVRPPMVVSTRVVSPGVVTAVITPQGVSQTRVQSLQSIAQKVAPPPVLKVVVAPGVAAQEVETFESISQNLRSYPKSLSYSMGILTTVTFYLPGGATIVKSLGYQGGRLVSVTLSGSLSSLVLRTKNLVYTGDDLTQVTYS